MKKIIYIFPYLGNKEIIKFGDLEIIPLHEYNYSELNEDEKQNLLKYSSMYKCNRLNNGNLINLNLLSVLKYKGTIFRNNNLTENNEINNFIYWLYFFINFIANKNYLNYGHCYFSSSSFELKIYDITDVFFSYGGKIRNCDSIKDIIFTKPENIYGLDGSMVRGIDKDEIDYFYNTYLKIKKKSNKFFNRLSNSIEFFFAINNYDEFIDNNNFLLKLSLIISSFESIFEGEIEGKVNNIKEIDKYSKFNIKNDTIRNTSIKTRKGSICLKLGILGRFLNNIYDIRNDYLHKGHKRIRKPIIIYKSINLNPFIVYDILFKNFVINYLIHEKIISCAEHYRSTFIPRGKRVYNYIDCEIEEYYKNEKIMNNVRKK